MPQVRYRPGDWFPEKYNRPYIRRKEIKNTARKMALEETIFADFFPIDTEERQPVGRRHYLRNRVLIAEIEAKCHACGLRDMQKKDGGRCGAQTAWIVIALSN